MKLESVATGKAQRVARPVQMLLCIFNYLQTGYATAT